MTRTQCDRDCGEEESGRVRDRAKRTELERAQRVELVDVPREERKGERRPIVRRVPCDKRQPEHRGSRERPSDDAPYPLLAQRPCIRDESRDERERKESRKQGRAKGDGEQCDPPTRRLAEGANRTIQRS